MKMFLIKRTRKFANNMNNGFLIDFNFYIFYHKKKVKKYSKLLKIIEALKRATLNELRKKLGKKTTECKWKRIRLTPVTYFSPCNNDSFYKYLTYSFTSYVRKF